MSRDRPVGPELALTHSRTRQCSPHEQHLPSNEAADKRIPRQAGRAAVTFSGRTYRSRNTVTKLLVAVVPARRACKVRRTRAARARTAGRKTLHDPSMAG